MQEELKKYAEEVGSESMTLTSLIDSHRYLRQQAMASHEERRQEAQRWYDMSASNAREYVLHGEYVSVAKLKAMTLKEIVDFAYDGYD